MIRLLDRYVLGTFLAALGVFTAAFAALFVTGDVAAKLGKFLELTIPLLPFMAKYYLLRLPIILAYLLPMVVLFAAMFTVVKLARTNEILPIAASGTSLQRMTRPFFAAALLSAGVMAAMDEYVLARLTSRIGETDHILQSREVSWSVYDWDGWTKLWALRYDHVNRVMSDGVRVTVSDDNARHVQIVKAKTGRWDEARKRWVIFDGEITWPQETHRKHGGRPEVRREPIGPEGYVVEARFKPETLRKSGTLWSRLPSSPLRELLEEQRRNPHDPKRRMRIHARLAFPLSPIILLLLGLPYVITAHGNSFFKGLFFCFLVSIAYYLAYFAFVELGTGERSPPAWPDGAPRPRSPSPGWCPSRG